jgi:hypothetical protein
MLGENARKNRLVHLEIIWVFLISSLLRTKQVVFDGYSIDLGKAREISAIRGRSSSSEY